MGNIAAGDSYTISQFRIDIPEADLGDLRVRLGRTRWPVQIPGTDWEAGVPGGYLRGLAEYWRTGYDWRAEEARLNTFPQFTTGIDGQNVHFLHVRSAEPNALPLIMTHGWPGSVAEFTEVIGPLTDPTRYGGDPADAFHVVAPSLPGFGFSTPLQGPGWDTERVARAWAELMRRLRYRRYGAQGGDTGSIVSPALGRLDPDHVVGVHVNGVPTFPSGTPGELAGLSGGDQARLERMERWAGEMSGYAIVQSTRPQTLAYGLTDSPVGQLAWIVEKFREWTDGDLPDDAVDRDQMLTNVTLYWLTGTAGSSARLYFEAARSGAWGPPAHSTVPTGVAVFPYEIAPPIRRFAELSNNIVYWSEFDRGGHFAAMEEPDLLVADVRQMFRQLR